MIFPTPKKEVYCNGVYKLCAYFDTVDLMELYEKYKAGNEDVTIVQNIDFAVDEYEIAINEDGIRIIALGDCGIFRAISSLRQLLKVHGASLPYCEIHDDPDFQKRSYMLDISRCRMPKVSTITRLIDLMAELKYNEFQLYMESFVMKLKHFPKYTRDFDCLTPADIEYLDRYCADRFIDLVPNQNCLGHMGTWLEEEEFKHLDVSGGVVNTTTLNPLLDETMEFADKLYDSILPHFSSGFVNIGLDEAYGLGRYDLEEVCREKGTDNVFVDWLIKLSDHIREKHGKRVQFWADMLYDSPEAYMRVPKDAVALCWGYDLAKTAMMERLAMALETKNVPYYICPGNCTWLSMTGRFDVASFNLRTCGEIGVAHGAIGYMVTDWGCGEGHMHFPVWSLVPMALGAQYAWHVGEKQYGASLKPYNIHNAQKYIDEYVFGAPVARWLCKMQQYYHLEPERIHCSTMCGFIIRQPLNVTAVPGFFDLKVCGEPFYFENVIDYMNKCLGGIAKVEFDEIWKRQAIVNGRMVVLSAELCIIRMTQNAENEKIDELVTMIDEICAEHELLWERENYSHGKEHFLNQLLDRRKELLAMKASDNQKEER